LTVPARPDVAIVGGGPAGLATAIAVRMVGLSAVVVDPRRPPLDKACGEGLMPSALAALERLGVELGGAGRAFSGIRYVSETRSAEADFPDGARGRSVRRTELHGALVRRAEEVEVELRWGVRATGLAADGVATDAGALPARVVVGADGLHSHVRAWAGLGQPRQAARRFGVRRHLALVPEHERVEVVFGRGAEAYLTATGAGETGVALLWQGEARGFDDLVARCFPAAFGRRLAGAAKLSRDRGAGPFRQAARRAATGRVALVGDAAGYVDALTGEGMAIAFREALALAPALATHDLAGYARASRCLRRVPEAVTKLALAMARRPRLRDRTIAAFASDPEFFSRLLGTLGDERPVGSLGRGALVRFGWHLLASPAGA
jgi:flavin-dependent dehydrogenase